MDHFDITRWTDYVRGLGDRSQRETMERHLNEGCESCARLAALLHRVCQETAGEHAVPDHLVLAAKAVFPGKPDADTSPQWLSLPRLSAELVFDSRAGMALEGARTAYESMAQMVYRAGDYSIELQVECEPESATLALVGQVIHKAAVDEPLAGVPVLLMAGKRQMAATRSNRFGEFCLISNVRAGLRFCMPIGSIEKVVEIPLTRILAGLQ